MEFSYMGLEDQECRAPVELPVAVKYCSGHVQIGDFLNLAKAPVCEKWMLAHQAVFLCCHISPSYRIQPERITVK